MTDWACFRTSSDAEEIESMSVPRGSRMCGLLQHHGTNVRCCPFLSHVVLRYSFNVVLYEELTPAVMVGSRHTSHSIDHPGRPNHRAGSIGPTRSARYI